MNLNNLILIDKFTAENRNKASSRKNHFLKSGAIRMPKGERIRILPKVNHVKCHRF